MTPIPVVFNGKRFLVLDLGTRQQHPRRGICVGENGKFIELPLADLRLAAIPGDWPTWLTQLDTPAEATE